MKIRIFIFCLFVSVHFHSLAQYSKEFKTNYYTAGLLMSDGNYQDALNIYMQLNTEKPNNANINFYIGLCYVNSIYDKTKAISYLEQAITNVSLKYNDSYSETKAPVSAFYYLGKAYLVANMIDSAQKSFITYKGYLQLTDILSLTEADHQIQSCNNAKKYMSNPVEIIIENLGSGVNSAYPDYSPVVSYNENMIIFTSRRPNTTGGKKDIDGKYFEDIYISRYDSIMKTWSDAVNIDNNVNTTGHEASVSASYDGKQLFIYKDDMGDGNIYVSYYINGRYEAPIKLPEEVNSKSWETHASLSNDGNILYFVSDRKGGYGGRDIYKYERLADGKWSKAINLGDKINTPYDEDSPFILPDGVTLYFSSKGHETMGGFDIFVSRFSKEGQWLKPENIGYPINTTDDDLFYMPNKDGTRAYYSSAKYGGYGDLDIYKITILSGKK